MSFFSVKFRGGDIDIRIIHNGGYEHDTGAHEVEWTFDGMTPVEIEALNLTDEEDQAITDQIYEVLNDPHFYDESDLL